MRDILFVAGETSGDTHAAGVARDLRAVAAPYHLVGVGGDHMQAAGVELIEHVRNLSVMGFVNVFGKVPRHWMLLRRLCARFASGNVALVVLVDYAGFNLLVAAAAARLGIPVLYFITPQVWASRARRLEKLRRVVTKAAVILPFEEKLLRDHGIDATFVGHPLMDRVSQLPSRAEARATLGIAPDARVLAVFPGSRSQEISHHLTPFVATATELQRRTPGLEVVVSRAPHVTIDAAQCPFPLVMAPSLTILRAADVALCKSGTTTLEAAVAGCPFIAAYRTGPIEYAAAKRFILIPDITLVNVLAGRRLVPEFVQGALQPHAMADTLQRLLDSGSPERATMIAGLDEVRRSLGEPGAATRVARLATDLADTQDANSRIPLRDVRAS